MKFIELHCAENLKRIAVNVDSIVNVVEYEDYTNLVYKRGHLNLFIARSTSLNVVETYDVVMTKIRALDCT